ncbi:Conserved_hypothetical protein [Hexamita inflata]|uniref:Uncharacterized protein n=1 Tax=Hexamita inflata TaxID=28002 RepID=A0AA86QTE7_9EUKA|nr:Conserved hypothetical protein [Hexamita inflata]
MKVKTDGDQIKARPKAKQLSVIPQFDNNKSNQVIKITVGKQKQEEHLTMKVCKNLVFKQARENYAPGAGSVELGFNSRDISRINLSQTYEGRVHRPQVRLHHSSETLSSILEQDTVQLSTGDVNISAFTVLSDDVQ